MRTETQTIVIFSFSELSDKAKQAAKDDFAQSEGFTRGYEALDTITKLAEHFDGTLADYDIDWTGGMYSRIKFDMPEDMSGREIRRRLGQLGTYNKRTGRGNGDCKLTGYCYDEDAIDGFRLAFRGGERDLNKLMDAAFRSLLKATEADYDYDYSGSEKRVTQTNGNFVQTVRSTNSC